MLKQNLDFCFGLCYDLLFTGYTGLPDMKLIVTQTQRAAAIEAREQPGSTEMLQESTPSK